jgi:hypothetical protein
LQSDSSLPAQAQFFASQFGFLQSVHLQTDELQSLSHAAFLSQQLLSLSQQPCFVSACDSSAADITAVHGTKTSAAANAIHNPFDIARSPYGEKKSRNTRPARIRDCADCG